MQYTDNEAALIGGLISNYFFQPSVDAKLRESYRRVLRHLRENTLSAMKLYDGIDKKKLQENMKYWLEAIMPICPVCLPIS